MSGTKQYIPTCVCDVIIQRHDNIVKENVVFFYSHGHLGCVYTHDRRLIKRMRFFSSFIFYLVKRKKKKNPFVLIKFPQLFIIEHLHIIFYGIARPSLSRLPPPIVCVSLLLL